MNQVDVETVFEAVEQHKDEAIRLLQRLVRIPSVNHPPTGDEKAVQEFYFHHLKSMGLEAEIVEPAAPNGAQAPLPPNRSLPAVKPPGRPFCPVCRLPA